MKKYMIICLALLLAGAASAKAQDKVEASVSMDLVTNYIWRGQHLGDVSMQPSLGYDFGFLSVAWYTNFYGNDVTTVIPFHQ